MFHLTSTTRSLVTNFFCYLTWTRIVTFVCCQVRELLRFDSLPHEASWKDARTYSSLNDAAGNWRKTWIHRTSRIEMSRRPWRPLEKPLAAGRNELTDNNSILDQRCCWCWRSQKLMHFLFILVSRERLLSRVISWPRRPSLPSCNWRPTRKMSKKRSVSGRTQPIHWVASVYYTLY